MSWYEWKLNFRCNFGQNFSVQLAFPFGSNGHFIASLNFLIAPADVLVAIIKEIYAS